MIVFRTKQRALELIVGGQLILVFGGPEMICFSNTRRGDSETGKRTLRTYKISRPLLVLCTQVV